MKVKWVVVNLVLVIFTSLLLASDHIDGPVTKANAVADLTDLYIFKTPGDNHSLTIALNLYPFVSAVGHFSEKVKYNIILRKALIADDQQSFETDSASEIMITCSFVTFNTNAYIQATCESNDPNHRIKGRVGFNQVERLVIGNSISLFAGRRLDPFFLSEKFADSFMKFQKAEPDGKNIIDKLNCLSIILNIKVDLIETVQKEVISHKRLQAVTGKTKNKHRLVANEEESFIAIAAESVTDDLNSVRRIDRIGRPEITNVTLNMNRSQADGEIRDRYNVEKPFEENKDHLKVYQNRIVKMVSRYDLIDRKQDWDTSRINQLAKILTDDFLLINPYVACEHTEFFAIEKSLLQGKRPSSCGGRDFNDNVVNKLYTLYEHGPFHAEDISDDAQDGLKSPTIPILATFPYLNPPDDSMAAVLKRQLALLFGP